MGPNHPLVNLIHKKTKIKKRDIAEVLSQMNECVPEAFFAASLKERQSFDLGGFSMFWRRSRATGAAISIRPTRKMKDTMTAMKLAKETPLAQELFGLMTPVNRAKALKKAGKSIV